MAEANKFSNTKAQEIDFASQLSKPDSDVWELIFNSLPDMVALIDLDNKIVKANIAMSQKINIGDQSLAGHNCYNLMHDKGCALSNCPHLSMLRDRQPHSIELFEPKFGAFLNISTTPIFDSNNNLLGSLHIARDISTQKASEAKLLEYNDELKELNRSRDKFFSIVAHDLRSPFQGMLGFTDLILDELDTLSKKEIKNYLQKVRDSSYSAFSLLENLLNWSRLQTGRLQYNPTIFRVNDVIEGIISLLNSNALSKNILLATSISDVYMVKADKQMVHSILLNLTTNAIKFTFPEGNVTIGAKITTMCEETQNINAPCDRKCLEVNIADTGVGISAEEIDKLFKINEHLSLTGTSNEQGAGLGLILVKEMAEKHGSKLTVKSEPGKGSVFYFTLPLAEE